MRNLLQLVKDALVPQSKKEWTISLVTIKVRNLSVMKKFYTQVLGLVVLQDFEEEILIGHSRGSVPLLRLVQGKGSKNSILTTYFIGFKLAKPFQMGELINRLILEEQTITATGFDGYTNNFYIIDPEGNRLKFMVEGESGYDLVDQYLEGTEMNRSLHEFIDGVDALSEEFPPSATIAQVHYNVADVEETGAFLIDAFLFNTTFDYVTKRKNFKINRDGYSLSINSWKFIPRFHEDFYGVSEIEWRVPNMRELENLVLNLEAKKVPFHYYDAVLKVPTKDGVQFYFKVGDPI